MHVHWLSIHLAPHSENSSSASDCDDYESVATFDALFAEWVKHQEQLRYVFDDRNEDAQENSGEWDSEEMDEGYRKEKIQEDSEETNERDSDDDSRDDDMWYDAYHLGDDDLSIDLSVELYVEVSLAILAHPFDCSANGSD